MSFWGWLLKKSRPRAVGRTSPVVRSLSLSHQSDHAGIKANLEQFVKNGKTTEFVEESLRERGADIDDFAVSALSAASAFAEALARDLANASTFLKKSGTARPAQIDDALKDLLPEGWFEESLGEIRAKNSGLKMMDRARAAHLLMRALERHPALADGTTIENSLQQLVNSADPFVSGNAEEALDILHRAKRQPRSPEPPRPAPGKIAVNRSTLPEASVARIALRRRERRVIRVFVSSTFQDMQAERDELMKRVFPRLRKLCEDRGVTWGQVDLRWGITDEQKAEGKVLPICLEEIARCRPYFMGVLGMRYGSPPDAIPDSLIAQQPWLAEHRNRSVTELEVLHGVLNNPAAAGHSFFYFRDPGYPDNPEAATPERLERLRDLKDRLRKSGLPVHENYPDPRTFGELAYEDLKGVVEKRFPPESLDPLEREAADHDFFAESRLGIHVGRRSAFDRLEQYVAEDGEPLVVVGQSGVGKSALLANWGLDYRERHPEQMVLLHFVGSTPQSAEWVAMVRRILGEIRRQLQVEATVPDQPDLLRNAFAEALRAAAAKARVVMLLDGLNQLEEANAAQSLAWLPDTIPSRIRLVISTLTGPTLDEATRRGWQVLPLGPLGVADRKEVITRYLKQGGRTLSPTYIEKIVGATPSANPLYLRMLLDELQLFGSHERLQERIDHYITAPDPAELAGKILERYERDYDSVRPGLVREAMSLLWAARRGLSEVEILDLLSSGDQPLPQAYWTPLYLAADRLLINRSGLIDFFHGYLRQAVQTKYLSREADQQAAHQRLADYFEAQDLGPRKVDELPWQLLKAHSWQRLADVLSELPFFTAAWHRDEIEVKTYWAEVHKNSAIRAVDAYRAYLDHPEKLITGARWLAYLLCDQGFVAEAAKLATALIEQYRQSGNIAELERALDDAGTYFRLLGRLDEALKAHREAETLARKFDNYAAVASCIGNQATVLRAQGKLDDAIRLLEEEEVIKRSLNDTAGLSINLGNRALVLQRKGDYSGALTLHSEEEMICRRLGDRAGLATCLTNQATALTNMNDVTRALQLLDEAEELCRALNDLATLQSALGSRVRVLHKRGDLNKALQVAKEQERICRQIGHQEGLAQSLSHEGNLLSESGQVDQAIECFRRSKEIYESLGDSSAVANVLGSWARLLLDSGNLDGAVGLFAAEEEIRIGLGDQPRWLKGKTIKAGPLRLKASLLKERRDLHGALNALREEGRICRDAEDYLGFGHSLRDQGLILQELGEMKQALAIHREEEVAFREAGRIGSAAAAQANQALLLANLGRLTEALPLAETAAAFADVDDGPKNALYVLEHIRSELPSEATQQDLTSPDYRCLKCGKVGQTQGRKGRPVMASTESLMNVVGRCQGCGITICGACAKHDIPAPGLVHFRCPDCNGRIGPA